jgi:hypothetical protein
VTGRLSFNDPTLLYSRVLRNNAELTLSWGYKKNGAPLESMFSGVTADLFTSKLERRGLKVVVLNPSGEGGQDGSSKFSCGVLSVGWFGTPQFATYDSGTKRSVLSSALERMGVSPAFMFIDFEKALDSYSSESVERQSETDFAFVARLASDWRCVFRLGNTQNGTTFAVFCEYSKVQNMQMTIKNALGVNWGTASVSWRGGDPGDMVALSYSWKNEEGENGEGDNVRLTYVNGKPTYQRFTVEQGKVLTWTINPELIKEYVRLGKPLGPILDANSFSNRNITQFWTSAEQTTAPNGLGYTVSVRMFGNPTLTAGMLITFNKGFPPCLTLAKGAPIQFLVRKATHTVDDSGYFTDIEVVDLLTVSAVGVR